MKIIILILLLCCITMAQSINTSLSMTVEIYLIAKDSSNRNGTTTFTMEAVSTVWDANYPVPDYDNLISDITNDYNYLTYVALNNNKVDSGWDFATSQNTQVQVYGYGKYRLTVGNKSICLDYRDTRCGFYEYLGLEPDGHPIDLWIKYNHDDGNFYYNSFTCDSTDAHWIIVEDDLLTLNIWDIKNVESPSTTKFEPYPPQNLTVTLYNGKPKLTWQHRSPADDYWKGYKIFRCITINNEPPTNFIEIASAGQYINTFTDNGLCFANWKNIHYKVKTKNTLRDSEYSNEVQINLTEEIINCNLNFTSDITVPSGKTLTIKPNITLTFLDGASIINNGTLNAIGTSNKKINLTSTTVDWGGIRFNTGSSGTLDYCNIINASTGIYLYNSSPLIKHSTIDDCSSIGIFCDYYASPRLIGNNIRFNVSYGLRCNSYSSPNLTDYGYPGLNVIRDNQSCHGALT